MQILVQILQRAAPFSLGFLGMLLMGTVDLLFVGKMGAASLAAVGLAHSIVNWVFVPLVGLMSGQEYLISKALGESELNEGLKRAQRLFKLVVQMTVVLSVIVTPILYYFLDSAMVQSFLKVEPLTLTLALPYFKVIVLSLPAMLLFHVYRQYAMCRGKVLEFFILIVVMNGVNAFLNDYFINHLNYGLLGSAQATLFTRNLMMIAAFVLEAWMNPAFKSWIQKIIDPFIFEWLPESYLNLKALFTLGWPISIHVLLEVGAFALTTLWVSRLVPFQSSAHQIVLSLVSLTFIIPYGIGNASGSMIAHALGAKKYQLMRSYSLTAFGVSITFMVLTSAVFLLFPKSFLSIYTQESQVIEVGKTLLLVGAFFQIFDGIQACASGVLRGFGETRWPMWNNLIGHWFVSLPLGYLLCFEKGWEAQGLWVGLASGLMVVAILDLWAGYRCYRAVLSGSFIR